MMVKPQMTNYEDIATLMKYLDDQFKPEPPHYIILGEDIEIEGMILKAGTYIDGVRQDD